MQIIKEQLDIDDELEKRIKNTLKFLNIKSKIIKGNIINIPKTNIAYIEQNKLEINGILIDSSMRMKKFILIV